MTVWTDGLRCSLSTGGSVTLRRVTEPNPTPDNWEDFYNKPQPPPPPQAPPLPVKKIVLAVIAVFLLVLAGWRVVSWSLPKNSPRKTPP